MQQNHDLLSALTEIDTIGWSKGDLYLMDASTKRLEIACIACLKLIKCNSNMASSVLIYL
jgi:hypothetical protein